MSAARGRGAQRQALQADRSLAGIRQPALRREASGQPGSQLDGPGLREFRLALDNVRMTAWTVSELHNAREIHKSPQVVISFLTAERLRRFSQMARDLCQDLERESGSWSAQAVNDLKNSFHLLRERPGTDGESR